MWRRSCTLFVMLAVFVLTACGGQTVRQSGDYLAEQSYYIDELHAELAEPVALRPMEDLDPWSTLWEIEHALSEIDSKALLAREGARHALSVQDADALIEYVAQLQEQQLEIFPQLRKEFAWVLMQSPEFKDFIISVSGEANRVITFIGTAFPEDYFISGNMLNLLRRLRFDNASYKAYKGEGDRSLTQSETVNFTPIADGDIVVWNEDGVHFQLVGQE